MAIVKSGVQLRDLEDWQIRAGPKSKHHWVDGRSAKEAARAWLEGGGIFLPGEVSAALAAHPDFSSVATCVAEPEAKLGFDKFSGEPRNSDLVVYATDRHGAFVMAVEAKADEPFGETVAEALAAALDRFLENTRSNGIARVTQLAQALLGPRGAASAPGMKNLRYQLLTACAGALCEAERKGCSRTLMLVHEFVTDSTRDENHRANANDLDSFVSRLSNGVVLSVPVGQLVGPFAVPGKPMLNTNIALYIGKVARNLRTVAAARQ